MPLNPTVHFADIGVLVGVLKSLTDKQQEFKDDVVAAVEQIDADYLRIQVLPTFIINMNSAANAITNGASNIVSACSSYLTTVLSSELPSTGTTVSGVITDLFEAMNDYAPAQTFLEDGNFHSFFLERYGRLDVPTAASGSNTVDDSLGD